MVQKRNDKVARAMLAIARPGRAPQHIGYRRWAVWCLSCKSSFVAGNKFADYCSQKCRDATRDQKRRHERHVELATLTRQCECCLDWFASENPRRRYCTDTCRNKQWRRASRDIAVRPTTCAECPARIEQPRANRRFCSDACRQRAATHSRGREPTHRPGAVPPSPTGHNSNGVSA